MNYNDTRFPTYAPALRYKEKDQHLIPYTQLHTLQEGNIIVIRYYKTEPNSTIGTVRYFIARIRSPPIHKIEKYGHEFTHNGTTIDDPEKRRLYNVKMEYDVLWIYEGEIPRFRRVAKEKKGGRPVDWIRNNQTLYHYHSTHTHRYYDEEENLTSMYKMVLHRGEHTRKYKSLHDEMVLFHNDKNTQRTTCMEYYRPSYLDIEGGNNIPLHVILHRYVGPKQAVEMGGLLFDMFPFDIYQMIMKFL